MNRLFKERIRLDQNLFRKDKWCFKMKVFCLSLRQWKLWFKTLISVKWIPFMYLFIWLKTCIKFLKAKSMNLLNCFLKTLNTPRRHANLNFKLKLLKRALNKFWNDFEMKVNLLKNLHQNWLILQNLRFNLINARLDNKIKTIPSENQ